MMEKKRNRATDSITSASYSSSDQLKGGRLRWTARDVMNLMMGVSKYGHAWSTIIKQYDFRGRNAKAISDKFYSIAGKGDRRSVYSKEEEERLIQGVKRFGCRSWRKIREVSDEDQDQDQDLAGKRCRIDVDCQSDEQSDRDHDTDDDDDEGEIDYEHDEIQEQERFHRFQQLLLAVAADKMNRGRGEGVLFS